jgi:[acyl-carrier-protein] S-malonyltransferase
MAKDLYDAFPEARAKFDAAHQILGFDLAQLCFAGPEEELKQTRATQPAIFVHSVILTDLLFKKNIKPAMTAGHSLGEYSALYAAGALSFEDALRVVKVRAELMQKAGEIHPGAMAAVIGLAAEALKNVCAEANSAGVVQIANYNSPNQLVISGAAAGVNRALELAKERGAKRAIPLPVSGAFHSPLMEYAIAGLGEILNEVEIQPASIPVYTNVNAKPVTAAQEIRQKLYAQLTSPVRWVEIVENMIKDGAAKFYEVGPGNVLTGLLKRINSETPGVAVNGVESLEQLN